MSEYKRNYPRRGHKTVRGFFFDADALNLSLEATGLAAHIFSFESDDIDEEFLKQMFPGRDLSGPLQELAALGLVEFVDPSAPPAPVVDVDNGLTYRRAGTIYLVEGNGRFKIGIAQSAKARLTSLQTGSPVKLRMVHHALVQDCATAEKLAHGLLTRFRLHGEWFECTEERARSVLDTVIEAVGAK
jgi:hypothetical protein